MDFKLINVNYIVILFILVIAGCGPIKSYIEPTQGSVAQIKLINTWGKSMYERHKQSGYEMLDQRELQFIVYKDKCKDPAMLRVGMPEFVEETKVPAGRRLYILAKGYNKVYKSQWVGPGLHGKDSRCEVPLSLVPENSAEYELDFDQSANKCFANINKWVMKGDDRQLIKDRTTRREELCK